MKGDALVEITYTNNKVKKYFEDYNKMQKKIPFEWVKTIKKHMDRLKAAECFGDFLALGLGKPKNIGKFPPYSQNHLIYAITFLRNISLHRSTSEIFYN